MPCRWRVAGGWLVWAQARFRLCPSGALLYFLQAHVDYLECPKGQNLGICTQMWTQTWLLSVSPIPGCSCAWDVPEALCVVLGQVENLHDLAHWCGSVPPPAWLEHPPSPPARTLGTPPSNWLQKCLLLSIANSRFAPRAHPVNIHM